MRILVFERDAAARQWLSAGIRARHHEVDCHADATLAWQAHLAARHPIVIVDWVGDEGRALCRRIRQAESGCDPVILASGFSDNPAELEQALRAGADDYLPKPADAAMLHARLAVAEARWRRQERPPGSARLGELEQALRESEERYALASRGANDGLWDWDLKTDEIHLSSRWKEMLGYDDDEIGSAAAEWTSRIHPDDVERVKAKVAAHLMGRTANFEDEHRMRAKDGSYRWVLARGFALRDASGQPRRMAGAQTDVTDRRTYDPLTRLPNRALFEERLSQAVARAKRRRDMQFALLFIDLDHFKGVNDSLGHITGDQLLCAVARRLETCLRPGDFVGRLGGDEFAILLEPVRGVSDATRVADRVKRELTPAVSIEGHEVNAAASVGIALSATGYPAAADVLRDADAAMYLAKAAGGARFEVFDERMRARATELRRLDEELHGALDRGELRIHYQPIISFSDGRPRGFEALLRWQHPERGLLLPADFIPLAEETGLIVPIGRWVLRAACQQMQAWKSWPGLVMSVNVSSRQLEDPAFAPTLRGILEEVGLEPARLRLEIAEHRFVEKHAQLLAELGTLGVRVGLDAFDTRRASLAALRGSSSVDALKLDRSFVGEVGQRAQEASIVRAIVAIARELGLSVIAEGVETGPQAAGLRALQCEAGQGYYFAPPMAAAEAEMMLAAPPGSRPRQPRLSPAGRGEYPGHARVARAR